MKKQFTRLIFIAFSFMMLINLSGCAKVTNSKGEIYPINNNFFWDHYFVRPIAWLMDYITHHTGGSFAIGIILATIVVRTVLFPVYTKSNDMSLRMQGIQPEVKKLQERYAGKTDQESRTKMNVELMQLYKDNNVSMFGGCLMPLLQMPVFIAMYNSVVKVPVTYGYTSANLQFLWLNSLASKDPYYILPILVGATAVLLQYVTTMGLTPEAKNNPTMKMMMWMMPVMMLVFSFTQASALSLYWIVGNIYSTLQYLVVKRPFKLDFKPFRISLKK